MTQRFIPSTAFAAILLVAGAASAQTTSIPAAPNASVGGQASTQTPAGVPNPTQRPDGTMPNARADVKADARAQNRNPGNTSTPMGEASTVTNGVPNATPAVGSMARSEVRPTSGELKPQAGQKGERPDVPTNPTSKTGTPK